MAAFGLTPTDMLRAAWTWWRDEMASMLPPALTGLSARWSRSLLIESDGDALRLSCRDRSETTELGEMSIPREASDRHAVTLANLVANRPGSYDRIVLRLTPDYLLRRRLRLPLAARGDLYEAVALDLDRQMPLPPEDLFFGVQEVAVHRAEGQVDVQLDAVRRRDVAPLLDLLLAAGLTPDRLDAAEDGANLLPRDVSAGKTRLRRRVTMALGGLAAMCTLLAAWLPSQRIEDRLAEIRADSAALRAEATRVADMRERMASLQARHTDLVTQKQAEPLALEVIAAATGAIDDDAFLLELTIDEDRLTINGYARTASEVLSAIDSAPMFREARFVSSVTQDVQLQRDRYTLSARIVSEPLTGASPDGPRGEGAEP